MKEGVGMTRSQRFYKQMWSYVFVAPTMIVFTLFIGLPMIASILLSFQQTAFGHTTWVGFDNFARLFSDYVFLIALKNTAIYTLAVVSQNVVIALVVATLISSLSEQRQTFFRSAFYLPIVTSTVIISMVFRWMLHPQHGLFNLVLIRLGFEPVFWLTDPNIALWSVILSEVLTAPGTSIVMFSAALNRVPETIYEAADIDGATSFRKWWSITLPLLKPTILYVIVMNTIGTFQVFSRVHVMTGGGPGYSTTTLVQLIYNTAFRDFDFGFASAQALFLFAIVSIISVIQFKFLSTDVEY